jgi:hypothetical protein
VSDQYYPGSKRKIPTAGVDVAPVASAFPNWTGKPLTKMVNGNPVDLYPIGALASALFRSEITIRLCMRKGYIPEAPFRLATIVGKDGISRKGRRLFTKPMIDAVVTEFSTRGILTKPRIEWSELRGLSDTILVAWRKIQADLPAGKQ